MKCPVCGTVYRPKKGSRGSLEQQNNNYQEETATISASSLLLSTTSSSPTCRRCKVDLSDLFRLHDQAIWYHRQALHLLTQGRYPEAAAHNNQALALYYSNADFHALAGKLSALQGEWKEAISSWQQALKFDPQNAIASNCLQMIELMAKSYYT
ncbi:tetratricopeptide repeat protein [Halotia wernerae UHCC 0503]|nr:tetratricopeptide repeat protein [Halotia wernerae UHCC 0503]